MKLLTRIAAGQWALLTVLTGMTIGTTAAWAGEPSPPDHANGHAEPEIKAGQQIFLTCVRCHGSDGLGAADGSVPAIAGQYPHVIISELIDFRPRYANRHDPRMERIANLHLLSQPQDLAEIASYVSGLPRGPVPAHGSGEFVSRGKGLYQAQCAGCHGAAAQGNERRGIPWLNSQHYEYLRREISYTAEQRRPNMVKDHAALFDRLGQQDVDGLADYLSRLPPR